MIGNRFVAAALPEQQHCHFSRTAVSCSFSGFRQKACPKKTPALIPTAPLPVLSENLQTPGPQNRHHSRTRKEKRRAEENIIYPDVIVILGWRNSQW